MTPARVSSLASGSDRTGEWLKYTIYNHRGGRYLLGVRYATLARSTALGVTIDDETNDECTTGSEGLVLYDVDLPSTEGWHVWRDTREVIIR